MTQSNSDYDQVWLAFKSLENIVELVKLADQKASFLLTVELALIGGALSLLPETLELMKQLWAGSNSCLLTLPVGGLYVTFTSFLAAGSYSLYEIVKPRLEPNVSGDSVLFFRVAASRDVSELAKEIRGRDQSAAIDDIAQQIVANSKVAVEKYKMVERSLKRVGVGVILGVAFFVVRYAVTVFAEVN